MRRIWRDGIVAVTETRPISVTEDAFKLLIDEIPELASTILFTIAATMADRLVAANVRYRQDMVADFLPEVNPSKPPWNWLSCSSCKAIGFRSSMRAI
jgi:hypothetical protein